MESVVDVPEVDAVRSTNSGWSKYSWVSQNPANAENPATTAYSRVVQSEIATTHVQVLPATRDDSALFIGDNERVQAGAVLARPHCREQLPVVACEPKLYLASNLAAHEPAFVSRQSLAAAEEALRARRRQAIPLTPLGCWPRHGAQVTASRAPRVDMSHSRTFAHCWLGSETPSGSGLLPRWRLGGRRIVDDDRSDRTEIGIVR